MYCYDCNFKNVNYFKKILNKFKNIINNSISQKIIRYTYTGNEFKYIIYNWSIEHIKIKNSYKNIKNENSEYVFPVLDSDKNDLDSLILEYQNEFKNNNLFQNHFDANNVIINSHLNFYPFNKNFRIAHDTYYSRMPYHVDSSKYTIIHQNQKGFQLKNKSRILMNENRILLFDSKLEHRVELNDKERFSISTFIFE